MARTFTPSRRAFVVGSAAALGGLVLGVALPGEGFAQGTGSGGINAGGVDADEINAWVEIRPDETVVVRIARSEMGQGVLTGLAQLVAEELGCDWSRVTTDYASPTQNLLRAGVWGPFATGSSRSIRGSEQTLRRAGAAARMMLVEAAARGWGVPAEACSVDSGVIRHDGTGRTTTFGAVAAAASRLVPPTDIILKDPSAWTIAGRSLPRLDTPPKLTGHQLYAIDVSLPGMLAATVRACPVFGGTVAGFDAAAIAGMAGVRRVLQIDEATVAVVADTWWQAKTAIEALPIDWDGGPNAGLSTDAIDTMVAEGLDAEDAFVGARAGDAAGVLAASDRLVTADYAFGYQAHGAMEPINATALWTPERCEVWAPTQNGEVSLAGAAAAAGLPPEQCEVHKTLIGGAFGRRGHFQDFVRQAVQIAKAVPGTPVKLIWTREEDFLHDHYHPTTQCRMTGALDDEGRLTALHMRISGQSIMAAIHPEILIDGMDPTVFEGVELDRPDSHIGYGIGDLLVDHAMRNPPVPPGVWRAVNLNQNAFYLESFIDELASEAGIDALEFRRRLMAEYPKNLAVLEAVAERIGWGTPAPDGRFRGLAQAKGYGSYVAAAAEISVEEGEVRVHRLVGAIDCGHVVNPAQVERQIEGSFAFGLSACLYGECTIADGRMEQDNFDSYEVVRLAAMPDVETIVMPSGGFWGGVGEPMAALVAPAVLNAVFAATGRRIRRPPLKNYDFSA
jgi:isoquinoline 1-oxidoreductase beta subunit